MRGKRGARDAGTRRRNWMLAAVLLALLAGILARSGPPVGTSNPPGAFSFAVLGDAPYHPWEELQYRLVLRALDAGDLSFVVHVGDIFWRPCSDERYEKTLEGFNGLRHAVVYTPGDNEWADCWKPECGGHEPRERLERIRRIFFSDPARSLGRTTLTLVAQSAGASFPEFVENARWVHRGVAFATVHIVGSGNATEPFPQRSTADDAAAARRTEAAVAWIRETFAEAESSNASAVVVAFHGNPGLRSAIRKTDREGYDPFVAALEEEVERFAKPVLAVHGDGHVYTVDHPLVRRTTGRRLENFTRLQVPGSPRVGWVRVVTTPGAAAPFAFEEHVIPSWKYW